MRICVLKAWIKAMLVVYVPVVIVAVTMPTIILVIFALFWGYKGMEISVSLWPEMLEIGDR